MTDLSGVPLDLGTSPIPALYANSRNTGTMRQVYKIASNPDSVCFYLNHSYLYPYGNSPAIDLTGGCQIKRDVDFLLLGCGDIRNILFTIKTLDDETSKSKNLHFYLNDIEGVILARNLILFKILEIIDPDKDEDVEFLWSVWYDAKIPKESLSRLMHIIQDLLENVPPFVDYMTKETEEEVKSVLKYWLIGNMSHEDVKDMRFKVLRERLLQAKNKGQNIIPHLIYGEDQVSTWIFEIGNFVDTGSSYKEGHQNGSGDFSANPTLLCPQVAGWRVHPDATPFHSYNLYGLIEGQSLFRNCLSQLKTMLWAWRRLRMRKDSQIMISLWLEHCLTLCNNIPPSDKKFDFIHTSNVGDHVGFLNLLVACSGLLNRSGILTMESFRWSVRLNSIEVFLNDQIGVPSSFFPTVFGLRLAEDFQMGTSIPRSLHDHIGSAYVVIRWLEAEKEAERIDINDSPELIAAFRGLVQACMPLEGLKEDFITPSLLLHIVRKMKDRIVGGARTLLDIIINSQPRLKTRSGNVFYPHENCFRAVWMAYRDQLGCDWPGDQEEHGLLIFEIHSQPNRDVKLSNEKLYIGKVFRNRKDCSSIAQHMRPPDEPCFFVTTITYKMPGIIKYLLPTDVWDSLGHSSILVLHTASNRADELFKPIAIKQHPSVKMVGSLSMAIKSWTGEEKTSHLKVMEYKEKYEIHMKWQESLREFPYLKVERGLDNTELLIDSKSTTSTCKLRCPVLDVQTISSLSDNSWTIRAKKDLNALNGPFILKYRRLDIQLYPTERKSTWQFSRILTTNFRHENWKRRGIGIHDDPLYKVTQRVLSLLEGTKIKSQTIPLPSAYFIAVKERNPDQLFGDVSNDIFILSHECYLINEILSVDIDWIDFEKVNLYITKGKLSKREVNEYCRTHGGNSSETHCFLEATQKENELLRKWLILNTMKSKQREVDQEYQWRFNCFLQPVYTINDKNVAQTFAGTKHTKLRSSANETMKKPEKVCSSCSRPAPDLKACARCRSAVYCGKECQKKDWPTHKHSCKQPNNTSLR